MKPQQAWLYITLQPLLQSPEPSAASHQPDSTSLPGPPPESAPLRVVRCQAGGRLEEPLEVRLTGGRDAAGQEGGVVCVDDFKCEVRCDNEEQRPLVAECVAVSVAAAGRDPESGVVALTANLVYTPRGPQSCSVFLAVRCVSGAHWTFPLTLVTTEIGVDDYIAVTAAGLGISSTAGLHLHNPIRLRKSKVRKDLHLINKHLQIGSYTAEVFSAVRIEAENLDLHTYTQRGTQFYACAQPMRAGNHTTSTTKNEFSATFRNNGISEQWV
ncbi:unnamed protein product [Boreogadus saida]